MQEKKEAKVEKEKCFVIMPISDQPGYLPGHFQKIYEQIFCKAIIDAGYEPYRVDEDMLCDSIIEKIFSAIQECPMAICDLSSRNPNVLYELGIRQAYDMPVVIVADERTEKIFDVSGINTHEYKSTRLYEEVIEARKSIAEAIIANKDKKNYTNSLVRLLNTRKAAIENTVISKDDGMEYAILSLTNEVNAIRKKLDNEYNIQQNTNSNEYDKYCMEYRMNLTDKKILNEKLLKDDLTDTEKTYIMKMLTYENARQYINTK